MIILVLLLGGIIAATFSIRRNKKEVQNDDKECSIYEEIDEHGYDYIASHDPVSCEAEDQFNVMEDDEISSNGSDENPH